jgi:hypothetical protein
MKSRFFVVVTATFVVTALGAQTRALDFDFAKIVDTSTAIPGGSGNFTGFSYFAFKGGQLAFIGSGAGQTGIYSYKDGTLRRVADLNTPVPSSTGVFTYFGDVAVDTTTVAFTASGASQEGIYADDGGTLSRIVDQSAPVPSGTGNFSHFGRPLLENGSLAFWGSSGDGFGIYSNFEGSLNRVADVNTPVPSGTGNFGGFEGHDLSPDGSVAFHGFGTYIGDGEYDQEGIYIRAGGSLTRVADRNTLVPSGSGYFSQFSSPSAHSGSVAFLGGQGGLPTGIYWNVGGPLTVVADTNTQIPDAEVNFYLLRDPSLEDGSLAFEGIGSGRQGIYTNLDGPLSTVIDDSTLFDGKLIYSLIGPVLSNENIAFRVDFHDSSEAFYVAEQHYTYTANTSGAWDTASNWSFGLKPRAVVGTWLHPEYGMVITGPASPTTLRWVSIGTQYSGVTELRLDPAGQLTVNEFIVVDPLGRLNVNGGVATGEWGIDNWSEIDLAGGQINGGGMNNWGTLRGGGTVGNYVQNFGRIQAIDSQIEFTAEVNNTESGRIDARNALLEFRGGLRNSGHVNFSFGTSDVFGQVQNEPSESGPGGQIIVSGNSNVTFYDDLTHTGAEFRVSAGSTAVFFGQVTASSPFTGGGTKMFEGGLVLEGGPISMQGEIELGELNTLAIDLGGEFTGQFDKLEVDGRLTLDGTLDIQLADGFMPAIGHSFDILDWTSRSGQFDDLQLPDLLGSLSWDTSQLYASGVLSVVAPGLPGDFNGDGSVDAADYVIWRKTDGTQADYETWRANFGRITDSGAADVAYSSDRNNVGIPEPGAFWLALSAAIIGFQLLANSRQGTAIKGN